MCPHSQIEFQFYTATSHRNDMVTEICFVSHLYGQSAIVDRFFPYHIWNPRHRVIKQRGAGFNRRLERRPSDILLTLV